MDKTFQRRLLQTETAVIQSEYFARFLRTLANSEVEISQIVAYGLGKVSLAIPAMHQAIFCSKLGKKLNVPLSAYDPIFSEEDWQLLSSLGFEAAEFPFKNCRTGVLVFMPHCDIPVNNAILAHLAAHSNFHFLLFCNTLTEEQCKYVPLIEPLYGIGGAYPREDVFNQCSLYLINKPNNDE